MFSGSRRRRWRFLGAAPADQRLLVEAEAQHDLARAMREEIEALRRENDALRAEAAKVPQLQFRLALALVTDFMHTALRQRASVQLERTRTIPRRVLDAPTELPPEEISMSSTLYWRPVPQETPPVRELPVNLKKKISQRLWGHDGSLHGEEIELSKAHVPYLEGLADAGVDGAAELLTAIYAHGAVELWIAG